MDDINEQKIWELVGYILVSENRIMILQFLNDQHAIPSQISKKLGIRMGHTSNLLKGLENKKLIECINPTLKKGRIYKITDFGKKILVEINKIKK